MSAIFKYQQDQEPQLSVTKNDRKRDTSEVSNSLLLSLSKSLNLVMIRGVLHGESNHSRFHNFLGDVEDHMESSNVLNVFISLDSFDFKGLAYLHHLAEVTNELSNRGNYVSVYWNTKNDAIIQNIASDFHCLFRCDFHVCEI